MMLHHRHSGPGKISPVRTGNAAERLIFHHIRFTIKLLWFKLAKLSLCNCTQKGAMNFQETLRLYKYWEYFESMQDRMISSSDHVWIDSQSHLKLTSHFAVPSSQSPTYQLTVSRWPLISQSGSSHHTSLCKSGSSLYCLKLRFTSRSRAHVSHLSVSRLKA